jgi:outer membrane protein OmpA-like peptidoglycan-associated protein
MRVGPRFKCQDLSGWVATRWNRVGPSAPHLRLIGFADSVGPEKVYEKLSLDSASSMAEKLKGCTTISTDDIGGFGSQLSLAENGMAYGRKQNRRVEVWVVRADH